MRCSHLQSCNKTGPPPGVFFHINNTNSTQEDVIYANEYFESLEYTGPVLQPGDIAVWVRARQLKLTSQPHHHARAR